MSAPSHRFDIAIEADLIEEISRVYGYNNLPTRTPVASLAMVSRSETVLSLNRIRDQLVARGYYEAITYSFVDAALQNRIDPENEPIGLANPLSSEMSVMRTTIWSGLLKSLIYNVNRQQNRVSGKRLVRERMPLKRTRSPVKAVLKGRATAISGSGWAAWYAATSQG